MSWLSAVDVHVVSLPMRTRFRGIDTREAVLLRGEHGWGEFAPFLEYDVGEAATWLQASYEATHVGFPAPRRTTIPCNITVPALDPAAAADLVRVAGGDTVKVKVAEPGGRLSDDEDRVAAVRAALDGSDRRGGRIRVDANAGWSVPEAIEAIGVLDRAAGGLEYVEQPCPELADLAAVRRAVGVPIAADESIRKAADPLRVAAAEAADIAVIKVAPLGGVQRALQVVRACGLPCVVSSAIDTSVGLAAGAALAAALDELPYACGLGTARLLAADVTSRPLLPDADGRLELRPVRADPDLLAEYAAPPDRAAWWRARLTACAEALAAQGLPGPPR